MKKTLKIKGMHCKSCEMLIKSDLEDIGVKANIDSQLGKAVVEFDESKISLGKIKEKISKSGEYSVE